MRTTILMFFCLYFVSLQAEALIVFVFTPEEKACIEELNLNNDTIKELYAFGATVEDNTDLNNFVHCTWRKAGYQNEDGTINYEKLKESDYIIWKAADDEPIPGGADKKTFVAAAVDACQNNPPKKERVHGYTTKMMYCMVKEYLKERFSNL